MIKWAESHKPFLSHVFLASLAVAVQFTVYSCGISSLKSYVEISSWVITTHLGKAPYYLIQRSASLLCVRKLAEQRAAHSQASPRTHLSVYGGTQPELWSLPDHCGPCAGRCQLCVQVNPVLRHQDLSQPACPVSPLFSLRVLLNFRTRLCFCLNFETLK